MSQKCALQQSLVIYANGLDGRLSKCSLEAISLTIQVLLSQDLFVLENFCQCKVFRLIDMDETFILTCFVMFPNAGCQ